MIAALIIILLIILFLAFFIGKNLTNVCTLWLFKTYTDKSVVVVIFIAFAAGIIFSLLCYLIAKLVKTSHENEVTDAKNFALKQKKKEDKQNKKLAKKAANVKTNLESAEQTTDKVVNIEDRVHD
ncbi:MAG: hypothetical protein IKR64_01480 [Treponema sp.]|nr:hypothetical protein [Treponema sp.]